MTGETAVTLLVSRVVWVVVASSLVACAKTDAQAPAKEAPSALAAAPEAAEEATTSPPPPSAAPLDRWPQAEAKPGAEAPAAGGPPQSAPAPILAPAPRQKADDTEKKKESSRPSAAAKPAKGALGASEGRSASADEAEPALAVSESWTQLNVAYDDLTSALALSVPDCGAAERFRQNVCALAERICTLERDLPSTTPHNCNDGRTRCSDATSRYNAKCDH